MKRVFSRITAAILATAALSACSSNPDSSTVSGEVKVLAPINSSEDGKYTLKFIELSGLTDLQEVAGKFARFIFSPRIIGSQLDGVAAKGRFLRNTEGNYIPANTLSQQMVVIYAHMQHMAQLDDQLGAHGVNHWPRQIGVGVRVRGGMVNNAFYDGKTDSMLFVPYTQAELPIALNGGILAHEHFHSLFYKMVLKNVAEDATVHDRDLFLRQAGIDDHRSGGNRVTILPTSQADESDVHKFYHITYFRGMNEGLADFWGWMYTGDTDFIAASLPQERAKRSLKVQDVSKASNLPKTSDVKRTVNMVVSYDSDSAAPMLTGYAYDLATNFSRVMKMLADTTASSRGLQALEARRTVASWVVKLLPTLRASLEKTNDGSYYSSTQFVQDLASVIPQMNEQECQFLTTVFNNSADGTKASCKQDGDWKLIAE